jgi:hypothetical protein
MNTFQNAGDSSASPSRTRAIIWQFVAAGAAYTGTVIALFHGLIGRWSAAVPHDLGDPLLSTWILWWNAQRTPLVGEWWDGLLFYPLQGSLAFSDHRVGLAWLSSPIQWLGGTPVLAYNITLLSSFAGCALAAHALTWMLTRSHAAGAVSGLTFGFNPFRLAHISHLELLVVFWLPLALVALHQYLKRFDFRWLAAFVALWTMQGLSSGYYLFYSAPLIVLWAFWFGRDEPWRGVAAVLAGAAASFLLVAPVLLAYRAIQNDLLLTRSFGEIEDFSADILGVFSATPLMALWPLPSFAANGEGDVYLGFVAPLLVLAALVGGGRLGRASPTPDRWRTVRLVLAFVCAIYALIAAGTMFGAWSVTLGPFVVSASMTERPLGVAVLLLLVLGLTSSTFRRIWRGRSTFAFYVIAAAMLWIFSLGPRPHLLGHPIIYRGPYALLMLLPGFGDRLRVPARFEMIALLAVSTAAGIALVRLTASRPRSVRLAATFVAVVAIAADSWTFSCPMPDVPALVPLPASIPSSAAVLHLPLGRTDQDIAAVYQSIGHGRHVVNGYSGYEASHYRALKLGLEAREDAALTALSLFGPIAVVIQHQDDPGGHWTHFVEQHAGAESVERTGHRTVFLLPASTPGQRDSALELPVRSVTSNIGMVDVKAITDGNPDTYWATPKLQQGGEVVTVDLGEVSQISGVIFIAGPVTESFPRRLSVATSKDSVTWDDRWEGTMAVPALKGLLAEPRKVKFLVDFPFADARYVRLRQLEASPFRWAIAELSVRAPTR